MTLSLVLFVIAMVQWGIVRHLQVWSSQVGKLSDLHQAQRESAIGDSGLSGRCKAITKANTAALAAAATNMAREPIRRSNVFC
jgi:hypothetical protein